MDSALRLNRPHSGGIQMKNQRFSLFLELVVQFIWTAFLIILLLPREGGSYAALFLSPAYFWLLYISILFFMSFMFITMFKLFSENPGESLNHAFLYLLIPVFFFPIAKNARLGSASVNRRNVESILAESEQVDIEEMGVKSPANPFLNPLDSSFPAKNPDGTTRISDILTHEENFMGAEVEIRGIAEFDEMLPDGSFYLYRFMIFCCVADATPAGLIIYGVDAESTVENRWYRIKGRFLCLK